MTRDEAREYFQNHNLSYQDITSGDICVLVMMLNKAMRTYSKTRDSNAYLTSMHMSEKISSKYERNGTIKQCFLYVNSHYFNRRECISFNPNGFVGFAGWADDRNIEPIVETFVDWCDYLASVKKEAVGC